MPSRMVPKTTCRPQFQIQKKLCLELGFATRRTDAKGKKVKQQIFGPKMVGEKNADEYHGIQSVKHHLKNKSKLVGGFNPSEKYARQIGSFPQVGVNIKNI